MADESNVSGQRLDRWLWVSRFYRSRKHAASAVIGGHVSVNDSRGKPGRTVKSGDRVCIQIGQRKYNLVVLGFSKSRLGAPDARNLYEEPEWSREQREQTLALLKRNRQGVRYDRNKPDKRERRRMLDFKQKQSSR